MEISFNILIPLIPFVLGIILKAILDLNQAFWIIKALHRLPFRWLFRIKVPIISGQWEQIWEIEKSDTYADEKNRRSFIEIKQLGKYFYGEFSSLDNDQYAVYGEIIGRILVGKWYEKENDLGFYGAFELRIINQNRIEGIWLGHSNDEPNKINSNNWNWKKNEGVAGGETDA